MQKRIKIDKNRLAEIQENLKNRGYSLDQISSKIGSDFRNYRYKGHSMDEKVFQNLKDLLGDEIEYSEISYIDGKGKTEELNVSKSSLTAELFGIILGDGYLQSTTRKRKDRIVSAHRLVITLHSDEKQLKERTCSLLQETSPKDPQIQYLKDSDALQILVNSKELVEELTELGLKPGDKVENQVEVPGWIMENREYEIVCLKALVDTDGTVYRQTSDQRIVIQFKNHSKPLLNNFRQMCADLNIETSNAGSKTVQVADQGHVRKFLDKIKPLKASNIDF